MPFGEKSDDSSQEITCNSISLWWFWLSQINLFLGGRKCVAREHRNTGLRGSLCESQNGHNFFLFGWLNAWKHNGNVMRHELIPFRLFACPTRLFCFSLFKICFRLRNLQVGPAWSENGQSEFLVNLLFEFLCLEIIKRSLMCSSACTISNLPHSKYSHLVLLFRIAPEVPCS